MYKDYDASKAILVGIQHTLSKRNNKIVIIITIMLLITF